VPNEKKGKTNPSFPRPKHEETTVQNVSSNIRRAWEAKHLSNSAKGDAKVRLDALLQLLKTASPVEVQHEFESAMTPRASNARLTTTRN